MPWGHRMVALVITVLFGAGVVSAFVVHPVVSVETIAASTMPGAEGGPVGIEMTSEIGPAGAAQAQQMKMSMRFDAATVTGDSTMVFGGTPVPTIRQLITRDLIYMQIPEAVRARPGQLQGKQWVASPTPPTVSDPAAAAALAGAADFSALLRSEDGEARVVGTGTVRGVETTRYRVSVDAGELFNAGRRNAEATTGMPLPVVPTASGPATLEFWIDDDDVIRRMRMSMTMTVGATSSRVVTTQEMFSIPGPVQIEVPPADMVHVVGSLAEAQALLGGS